MKKVPSTLTPIGGRCIGTNDHAGGVDDDVDATVPLDGAGHGGVAERRVGDITDQGCRRMVDDVGAEHGRAGFGEQPRGGGAHAGGGAGDDRDATFEHLGHDVVLVCGVGLGRRRGACVAPEQLVQVPAHFFDVGHEVLARLRHLALLAQAQQLAVLAFGPSQGRGAVHLQAREAVAGLQQRGDDGQGARLARMAVQGQVVARVQLPPLRDVQRGDGVFELGVEGRNLREVLRREQRCRLRQHARFEQHAQVEDVVDLLERERRDDCPLVRLDQHQALGFELEEGLAHRNAADLETGGQGVLAQLFAGAVGAVQDVPAQLLDDGSRQGAVAETGLHEGRRAGLDM
jgi:hypothetical protein